MNRTNFDEQSPTQQPAQPQTRHGQRERPANRPQDQPQDQTERRGLDVARMREAGRNLAAQIEQQAVKRPFVVIGAAAGVGFVAGSLFGSRLGQVLLAAAGGYVAKNLLEGEIGLKRLQDNLEKLAQERTRV
jgi:hypothetical protein